MVSRAELCLNSFQLVQQLEYPGFDPLVSDGSRYPVDSPLPNRTASGPVSNTQHLHRSFLNPFSPSNTCSNNLIPCSMSPSNLHNNNLSTVSSSSRNKDSWHKPPLDFYKINCDASLSSNGSWGAGIVIRDNEGFVVAAMSKSCLGFNDPLCAEAWVMLEAVDFANQCGFQKVIVESDSDSLIKAVNNRDFSRLYWGYFARRIFVSKIVNFGSISFIFRGRSSNWAAHLLAQYANFHPDCVWLEECPLVIHQQIILDLST